MNTARKIAAVCIVLALIGFILPARADQGVTHALGLRMARPSPAMVVDDCDLPAAPVSAAKKAPITAFTLAPWMPAPMDQGTIGSCASCAVGYAWKSCTEGLRNGALPDDDTRTFCPTYLYNQVNGGFDVGSYMEDNLAVLCMRGITTLADQPYTTDDFTFWPSQGLCDVARAHRTNYANAKRVAFGKSLPAATPGDLAKIKKMIMKGTPVLLGIMVDDAFDSLYLGATNFVWYPNGVVRGGHAITLIGFNDAYDDGAGHVGAFEFQNSWGGDWCLGGRAYIAYDAFYAGGAVDSQVSYGVERKKYAPTMKAQVSISHAQRGDVFIQIGVGPVAKPKWSEWFYYPLIINTQDGIWDVENANIFTTLDVSGGAKFWPPSVKFDWWMRVVDNFGDDVTGSITQFSILGRTGGWVSASGPVTMRDMGDTFIHITGSVGSPGVGECPGDCGETAE